MIDPVKDALMEDIVATINENPYALVLGLVEQITQLTHRIDQLETSHDDEPRWVI